MDLSFLNKANIKCDKVLQLSPEYRNKKETLYYDETDNNKQVRIKDNGELNIKTDACFVLGGIQTENVISAVEMHETLFKKKELRAIQDLKGDFIAIMRKQVVERFLKLVYSKRWCFHFFMVQPIYYSFVDIVDSLIEDEILTFEYKSILCRIIKSDFDSARNMLRKYKYPDIRDIEVPHFLEALEKMITKYLLRDKHDVYEEEKLYSLRSIIIEAKNCNRRLKCFNNEESFLWVNPFVWFYRAEIASFPKKKLEFDQEDQVEKQLREDPIIVNGTELSNYSFIKSSDSPMIQLSDYVVAILKKYFVFLDRDIEKIEQDVKKFDSDQLSNFMVLNSVLLYSKEYNPLFQKFISNIRIPMHVDYFMTHFGA